MHQDKDIILEQTCNLSHHIVVGLSNNGGVKHFGGTFHG